MTEQAIAESLSNKTRRLYQGKVVDCQPLQQSVLDILLVQPSALGEEGDRATATTTSEIWEQMGIPALARPYFSLREHSPAIPNLHDAWQKEEQQVILLSDRSYWQCLSDLLKTEPLPTLQIIYWLNQMVVLWKALSPVNCCQSLLVDSNLRVDEDQSFGLQQLYEDLPSQPPSLKDLGNVWLAWFQQVPSDLPEALMETIEKTASGEIDTLADLRLQLQDLADAQQDISPLESENTSITLVIEELPEIAELEEDILNSGPQVPQSASSEEEDLSTAVLPMELLSLTDAGGTDRGSQRHHNEDYFGISTYLHTQHSNPGKIFHARGLYVVCDGMGGHAAGEVASKMAVITLQRYFATHWQGDTLPERQTILNGILLANQVLYEVNQKNASSGSGRMGTTLVMALVQDTKVAIAHVGDSRAYRFSRKGGLEQLTLDHEVGQKAIQSGIDAKTAYSRPDAYQLTQALGPHDDNYVQPDIRVIDIHEDSLLLLCSDGLSDNDLVEEHWETYLAPLTSSRQSLDPGINQLIEFANQHNGHDNITAILIQMKVRPHIPLEDW